MKYINIEEATKAWVSEFNAIPQSLIERANKQNYDFYERYEPYVGEEFTLNDDNTWFLHEKNDNESILCCYDYNISDFKNVNCDTDIEEIEKMDIVDNSDSEGIYFGNSSGELETLETYNIEVKDDEIKVYITKDNNDLRDYSNDENYKCTFLPAWGTMWAFGDSCDDYWCENNIDIMRANGFRVYEDGETGDLYFGIDGCGYNFYEAHWIPLYKARGLKWHEENKKNNEAV